MHATSWSPVDAFLDYRGAPASEQAALADDLSPNGHAGRGRAAFGAYHPNAIGTAGLATGMNRSAGSRKANADGFAPDRLHGAFAAAGLPPTASAGNLWRLLGLAAAHSTATPGATTHASTPRQPAPTNPASPKPPHPPSPHASTGGGTHGSPSTSPFGPIAQAPDVTTPAILIGNNPTPVSGLIGGGSTGSHAGSIGGAFTPPGHLSPGGAAGGSLSLSATPEPSSIVLIGMGLLGLAALRRRRSI